MLYELVLKGYDGATDETDDYILWVKVDKFSNLEPFKKYCDGIHPLNGYCSDAIEFRLPQEADKLETQIKKVLK